MLGTSPHIIYLLPYASISQAVDIIFILVKYKSLISLQFLKNPWVLFVLCK